ncbi:Hypothetical protein PHPALM_7765 [Phytophthora palmivora]|uniref:Uncharacterized protein n=1 Tax=Phytophthora palmivora TaxID=4796 RepID=A0A2P4YBH4_9STRA|nr:Hypothetical protein PHPALM_7765 [Phytophthora palmivora]
MKRKFLRQAHPQDFREMEPRHIPAHSDWIALLSRTCFLLFHDQIGEMGADPNYSASQLRP